MDGLLLGLGIVFTPWAFFYCVLGTVLGIAVGAIPGLTGAMLIALTLPLTYYMTPTDAVVLLIAMYVGAITGGLITATLFRMPGTPSNVMTTFDGYPMAKAGRPGRALGLGISASFVGGIVSWFFLFLLAKPLSIWATRFGPFEYFTLILMAMVLIASVSQGSLVKGLIAGLLGMLASMPGVDPSAGQPRLTFDWYMLNGGLKLLPVLIGVFAVSQIISDILEIGRPMERIGSSTKGLLMTLRDWRRNAANMLRSSLIGTWVGILPGVGASIGSVIAYTTTKNLSKTPERFGKGAEEGIIASEAANNATVGGALVPLIAMGIPGSVIDAILIGALMIHSIQPGPTLFPHELRRGLGDDRRLPGRQYADVRDHARQRRLGRTPGAVAAHLSLACHHRLLRGRQFRAGQHHVRCLGDADLRRHRLSAGTRQISARTLRHRLRARPADGGKTALRPDDDRRLHRADLYPSTSPSLPRRRPNPSYLAAGRGMATKEAGAMTEFLGYAGRKAAPVRAIISSFSR